MIKPVRIPIPKIKKASAPARGEGLIAPRYHPYSSAEADLICTLYAGKTAPITEQNRKIEVIELESWNMKLVHIHRSGSEASSSFLPTGLHQPPALLRKGRDYYSSSRPFYYWK